jgi:hypothetical protein
MLTKLLFALFWRQFPNRRYRQLVALCIFYMIYMIFHMIYMIFYNYFTHMIDMIYMIHDHKKKILWMLQTCTNCRSSRFGVWRLVQNWFRTGSELVQNLYVANFLGLTCINCKFRTCKILFEICLRIGLRIHIRTRPRDPYTYLGTGLWIYLRPGLRIYEGTGLSLFYKLAFIILCSKSLSPFLILFFCQ